MATRNTGRTRGAVKILAFNALFIVVTLVASELILRALNPFYLRNDDWGTMGYGYDAELGWSPIPNTTLSVALPRTLSVRHNSLGLRDIEQDFAGKPTIMFIGDSFVWGYNVEDGERFTDLLRPQLAAFNVVNAGVSGFGTDQELLLLQRLWPKIAPKLVMLMVCVDNDHQDNSANMRYFTYKPYLQQTAAGGWEFRGQPPPKSRRARIKESKLAQDYFLVRLAISAYVEVTEPRVKVPDPTARLIAMMRSFVEAHGAKLVVGLEYHDPQIEPFLRSEKIPYMSFDGAEIYDSSKHWTPAGHALVAKRIMTLFSETGVVNDPSASATGLKQ